MLFLKAEQKLSGQGPGGDMFGRRAFLSRDGTYPSVWGDREQDGLGKDKGQMGLQV